MGKKHSKKEKKRIDIKETRHGAKEVQEEDLLKVQLENPMVQLRYQYAIDVIQARIRLIHADLTEQNGHAIIRSMATRIKSAESVCKKLIKKEREVTFENAVDTLNDIAGIRVVCFFCDDIYLVAEAIRQQRDLRIIKEKDYVKNPKKSGYQSLHLIVGVPVTYYDSTSEVRVEIQIRSFAMDYWAELESQMCYKKSAGQISNVERKTRDYSDVIAKVDNEMLELRKLIEGM